MRKKKTRRHNRALKQIEKWRLDNIELNIEFVKKNTRGRIDIIVHPWCDISIVKSGFKEPNGKIKQKILASLFEIYDNWKTQLEKLQQPYYLKVWLYEPRFSKSEVVCAIGESLDFYKDFFFKPEFERKINPNWYGSKLKDTVSKYDWVFYLDEDKYFDNQIGDVELYHSQKDYETSLVWFNRVLKGQHRTEKNTEVIRDVEETYFFKRGYVWVGEPKENWQ